MLYFTIIRHHYQTLLAKDQELVKGSVATEAKELDNDKIIDKNLIDADISMSKANQYKINKLSDKAN